MANIFRNAFKRLIERFSRKPLQSEVEAPTKQNSSGYAPDFTVYDVPHKLPGSSVFITFARQNGKSGYSAELLKRALTPERVPKTKASKLDYRKWRTQRERMKRR